ncbi:MAG: pyridoxal-phosphate dependent enzyme [Raineya sp.]|jgi:1-aminocyclopropane-1-carboxylate deaminase|nr:pyridoxal-phosphate dependent enzyme [Raineya sp.]
MFSIPPLETLIERLENPLFVEKGVSLYVLRLDKLDKYISGNKWFKLKYNLLEAQKKGFQKILTFGGAFSNHIVATASAGKLFNLETIGIIRGEEILPLNPRLQFAQDSGMALHYLDREQYREKTNPLFIETLKEQFGDFYLIPEGGSNALAIAGTAEILSFLPEYPVHFDAVCTCVGTAGTLTGLAVSLFNTQTQLIGIATLKNASFLYDEAYKLLESGQYTQYQDFNILLDYHFGGYAKSKPALLQFIETFEQQHSISIEPVYTGKLFYGIFDSIKKGFFKPSSNILVIHCGGIF